ncbi:hypothetical protein TNCV_1960791 [Trichonephila clavipes]|nr:hypothetical protein TNCV_1960791 [Trichonephila clavipes]
MLQAWRLSRGVADPGTASPVIFGDFYVFFGNSSVLKKEDRLQGLCGQTEIPMLIRVAWSFKNKQMPK